MTMKHKTYPACNTPVSTIGFGGWQLGKSKAWEVLSDADALRLVHQALDLGVNFFDTAPNYGFGTSEERLGKALRSIERSKYVLNTKFGHTVTGHQNFDPRQIRTSLEGSLKRLGVDCVDSLIIHNPPRELLNGNTCDHYDILEQLQGEGKIMAYGASVDTSNDMNLFMQTTGGQVIECLFNILHQDTRAGFDLAARKGVGLIIKIPLDSGWLTGRFDETSSFQGVRSRWSKQDIHHRAHCVHRLKALIPEGLSLSQVALAFCLAYPTTTTVIPGQRNFCQLESNVKSVEFQMSLELRSQLETFFEEEVRSLNLPW